MSIKSGIISTGVGSPTSRTPLQPRTSSPSPTSTLKQVRRKNSFLRRVDSSEDYPSPHDSIFEAFYFSGTNSDESNSRIELITLHGHNNLGVTKDDGGNNENREPSMPPISNPVEDAQFRYGHGTVLETITEQRSFGTMRTISRTKSADDMPNFPFLNHRDSFILAKSPRRKQSFSLDDLALINRSYHEACAMIERETCKKCTPPLLEVPEIYAQPMKPLHAPPNRPPTPPGMPSWTAAQNAPPRARRLVYSTPAKLNRFQRFFGLSASDTVHSSRVLPPGNVPSQGRVVSTPVGGRTAPRFRPPRSAYGPIDQHPFSRAPIAKVVIETAPAPPADAPVTELSTTESGQTQVQRKKSKGKRLLGKRVRFTPSATARDSEALALQAAIESTSASAVHPLAQIEAPPQSQVSRTKHACHHYRRSQPQSIVSRIDEIVTPPSINYDDLPSETPPRLQPIGPRQFLSPVSSPNGQNSSSLSLGESLISADLVTDMPTLENRISSVSSTAQLMSGALRSATASPDPLRSLLDAGNPDVNDKASWCWKCKIERSWRKIDRWLVGAASKACFVCCGYDDEDDGSVAYSDNGAVFNPFNSSLRGGAGTSCQRVLAPRRVLLEEAPEITF